MHDELPKKVARILMTDKATISKWSVKAKDQDERVDERQATIRLRFYSFNKLFGFLF